VPRQLRIVSVYKRNEDFKLVIRWQRQNAAGCCKLSGPGRFALDDGADCWITGSDVWNHRESKTEEVWVAAERRQKYVTTKNALLD
jgi:hypothetical protein